MTTILRAAFFLWLAVGILRAQTPAPPPPNVVIILTDDLGYADVGVFGAKGIKTPNLDRLAAEGRTFTNFHAPQPVCSASRCGLLTGCYSNRLGIHGALGPQARHGLAASEVTLAALLQQQHYATGMAGKWHLGSLPQFLPIHRGFEEYLGLPYSNDMWPFNPEAKPNTYPPLPMIEGDRVIQNGLEHADQEQLTTRYTERAVQFIERNRDRPFFFYLAHNMPHVPLHVSDKFRGKSERGLYGDVVMEIDWSVGEVMRTLERLGLAEKTLVIFTSDNGPWLSYGDHAGRADPLREGKGTCWEGGTRVPCIMRWPGRLPAGTSCPDMLCSIDLLPTIAKLAGAPLPKNKIDGLDVWPILAGQPGAENPHEGYAFYYENNQLQAVVNGSGSFKLQLPHTYRTLGGRPGGTNGVPVRYEQRKLEQPELYYLPGDIGEEHDCAAERPKMVIALLEFAAKMRADLGDSLTNTPATGARPPDQVPASAGSPPVQGAVAYQD